MKIRNYGKKLLWILLVVIVSVLLVWRFQIASKNVRIYQEPDFDYYFSLFWEILKELAVLLPVWFLSLLGLARSFLGDNWFPFTEKIPIRVTKVIVVASGLLLIGTTVAGTIYAESTGDTYIIQYILENRFEAWRTTLAWILFYSILLYIEQWGIQRNCCRKGIRKKQAWTTITMALTWMILFEISCVDLWYIPLSYVSSPNTSEDYYLWWFSLYSAVFILPLWFFAARKTIRLFKNNMQWLDLSSIVPAKITALIALASTALMISQIRECRYWSEWIETADVPEYGEAAAMKHIYQAMMWGLMLFYMICLFVKQIRAARKEKREK